MRVTLLNPFRVFEGREAEFLHLWDQTGAIFAAQPGFVSARLVRAAARQPPGQRAPYTHVNVAVWRSAQDYEAALRDPELRRLAARYAEVCTFAPALYETLRDLHGSPESAHQR